MATVHGVIYIDFETEESITQEQFKEFKKILTRSVEDDFCMAMYNMASACKFEIDDVQPILVDELDCEYDEED